MIGAQRRTLGESAKRPAWTREPAPPSPTPERRVPAIEILVESPTVKELLHEGKTHELYGALKEGGYYGCQTFNHSLKVLYQDDLVTLDNAMAASDFPDELKRLCTKAGMERKCWTDPNTVVRVYEAEYFSEQR